MEGRKRRDSLSKRKPPTLDEGGETKAAEDALETSLGQGNAEIVQLNIGGQLFTTTLATLRKGDTMLSKMFSGNFKLSKDTSGNPYIDRDGTHFRIILNFLRTNKFVPPSDPSALQEILEEADYYQCKELSLHIQSLIEDENKVQYCKILCNGDWIGQLNYLTQKGWVISKFMLETESKYRELDDYGKALKHGIGWYDIQTQCILLKKPLDKL